MRLIADGEGSSSISDMRMRGGCGEDLKSEFEDHPEDDLEELDLMVVVILLLLEFLINSLINSVILPLCSPSTTNGSSPLLKLLPSV